MNKKYTITTKTWFTASKPANGTTYRSHKQATHAISSLPHPVWKILIGHSYTVVPAIKQSNNK